MFKSFKGFESNKINSEKKVDFLIEIRFYFFIVF